MYEPAPKHGLDPSATGFLKFTLPDSRYYCFERSVVECPFYIQKGTQRNLFVFQTLFQSLNTKVEYIAHFHSLIKYGLIFWVEKNEIGGACSEYGGEERHIQGFGGKPEGKGPLGIPRCRWRIILRWILRKWYVGVWTGSSWLKIGTGGRHL
jgi:hypothetical protein